LQRVALRKSLLKLRHAKNARKIEVRNGFFLVSYLFFKVSQFEGACVLCVGVVEYAGKV
jgi:hypothetical protein